MFGIIYTKSSESEPIDPVIDPTLITKLIVDGAPNPKSSNLGLGMWTYANGDYLKYDNNSFYYDVTQDPSYENYDPEESESNPFDFSFSIVNMTFNDIIRDANVMSDDDEVFIDKIFINGVETNLTGTDNIYLLKITHEWEGPFQAYVMLYYSLTNITGTYNKANIKITYQLPQEGLGEFETDPNDTNYNYIFGKTYAELPATINVTAQTIEQ